MLTSDFARRGESRIGFEKRAGNGDKGVTTMKTDSKAFLLFVAIVTSAIVLPIRLHTLAHPAQPVARVHAPAGGVQQTPAAAYESTRGNRRAGNLMNARLGGPPLWV
jgi:hypothetical protein